MKILITGAAGFLGSHLSEALLKEGHSVVGIDNMVAGYEDNIVDGVEFYKKDLCNLNDIKEHFIGVDVVYHCAANPHEGLSVFSPKQIVNSIVDVSTSVISASIDCGVKRIISMSSMARYGEQEVPFTEDMKPKPQDPYGIAKVAVEDILKNLCTVHGMEYVIVVPHNIIGPRQKYDDPFRNVASIMINKMLRGEQPIIYGDGEQKRCFSFIQDDIDVLLKMIDSDISGETINVGPDEEFVTINQLAEEIADIIGIDLKPIYYPGRPQEVKNANCSADKARRLFGYKTKYSLRNGLKEMIEYIENRGPKEFDYYIDLEIVNELTPETWKEKKM